MARRFLPPTPDRLVQLDVAGRLGEVVLELLGGQALDRRELLTAHGGHGLAAAVAAQAVGVQQILAVGVHASPFRSNASPVVRPRFTCRGWTTPSGGAAGLG
jgi:hypothetical protein